MISYYGSSLGIHLGSGKLTTNSYTYSTVEDVKKYFDAGSNAITRGYPQSHVVKSKRLRRGFVAEQ